MAKGAVSELVIQVTTDAEKAASGLDSVGGSAVKMSADVEKAGAAAEKSSRSFGVSAEAADDLGGKAGKATGALGALSAGFELVGAEKYAVGLQSASMATDFFSGVGDSLNLVMESTIVKTSIARARAIALGVTQRVVGAATRVWAAGQWALNAALNANPIGLVVVAVVLLVGLLVLAYRRSASFRSIVQTVGRVGSAAIRAVVGVVSDLVKWIGSNAPAGFNRAKSVAVTAFRLITLPARTFITVLTNVVTYLREKVPGAFETAKRKASAVGDAIAKPFRTVIEAVKSLIGWIGKIRIPKISLPRIPGTGRILGGGGSGGNSFLAPSGGGGSTLILNMPLTVNGAIDEVGTARTIRTVVGREAKRLGRR